MEDKRPDDNVHHDHHITPLQDDMLGETPMTHSNWCLQRSATYSLSNLSYSSDTTVISSSPYPSQHITAMAPSSTHCICSILPLFHICRHVSLTSLLFVYSINRTIANISSSCSSYSLPLQCPCQYLHCWSIFRLVFQLFSSYWRKAPYIYIYCLTLFSSLSSDMIFRTVILRNLTRLTSWMM